MTERKVRTCFWFARRGIDAAQFYVTLLPDSRIDDPMIIEFTVAGAPMMILTGGEMFEHSPAASISVLSKDQAETDRLWSALLSEGGKESMCGWLTDRFGISWQIVPEVLPRLFNDPDTAAASRARAAMMQMKKIDIAALEAAFHAA
jgi:predicted 3-demethylubiquinone-9 3-methyltransferase (glyoxalase superfamily)